MLEAYWKNRKIGELADRLPNDAEQVRQELADLLDTDSEDARSLFLLARCHLQCGDEDEARSTLEKVLALDPSRAAARTDLAALYFKEGKVSQAITLLEEATAARPEVAEPWGLLSEYLKQDGQAEASMNALRQFDMIKVFNDKLRAAEQSFANMDFQKADSLCRELLQLVPNEVRTLRLLSRIARQFNHVEFSTTTLARCVEARPDDVALGLEYGYSLLGSRMYQEALAQFDLLAKLAPEIVAVYDLKAEVLFNLGRYEEAIAIYRELSELPEKRSLRLLHLGKVLKTIGEIDEAVGYYRQVIEADPTLGQAYWELADLKTYRFSDDEIESMQQLLKSDEIRPLDKVLIQFAVGKALEDAQKYEESFEYYQSANSGYTSIRPSQYVSQNDQLMSFFTSDHFASAREHGNETDAPIFVLGLPRSGSTLVEQILSCHSQVDATQELDEIVTIARSLTDPNQSGQGQYPQSLADLSASQVQDLAQRYLNYVQPFRRQAPHFVDKAPHNFHHIGLIKTLFPNAKIIDIRRNPMASGWSLYRQFFAGSFQFSYDLETIGKYSNDYIALMNHWHSVLPGQVLTVNYEDLVADLPATVKTMLQHCGLAFEDACIDFHLNKRAVATPSSEQVRQPLYKDALEHWKNYETHLEPLRQAIENEQTPQES